MLQRAAAACAGVTACVIAAILIGSAWILGVFGREFVVNQHLLLWIGAAQLFNVSLGPAPQLLMMTGSMRSRIAAQIITLIVQASTAWALIPEYGSAGAAASLVCAIVTWAGVHWFLAKRATGIDTSIYAFFVNSLRARS